MKKNTCLVIASIAGVFTIVQIILYFVLYNAAGIPALRVLGWITWALSVVFGVWPIMIFRAKGGVEKGSTYIQTTALVDTGLYAIVRHPQYLAWVLLSVAFMLLGQHWLVVVLGVPPIVSVYLTVPMADQGCIEKFGQEYERYAQRVPPLNFLAGILRLLRRRESA